MATLSDLVSEVRDVLYGARTDLRPKEDTVASGFATAGATAGQMATPGMWIRNRWAQFEPDGEILIFAADHPTSGDATVRRGQRSTTAAGHSVGDVALYEPQWPRHQIERKISRVIDSDLWPHIWLRTERTVASYSNDVTVYELDATDVDIEQMYQYDLSNDNRLWPMPTGWYEVVNSVATSVPTGGTSNKALRLYRVHDPNATVYYTAKTKPTSAAVGTLPTEMLEMVVTAAAGKLLLTAPAERRQRPSGRSRTAGQIRDYSGLMAEFLRMRTEYSARLKLELMKQKRFKQGPRIG